MQKLIPCSQIDPGSVYDGNSNGTEYLSLKPVMANDSMRKKNRVPDTHNYLGNSGWFLLVASSGDYFIFLICLKCPQR